MLLAITGQTALFRPFARASRHLPLTTTRSWSSTPLTPQADAQPIITASFSKGGAGLKAGDYALLRRAFSDEDVRVFARVTGDNNAIHLDDCSAAQSVFKRRVVHGMLTSSLFSAIFGSHIPGCIYLDQTLTFKKPVYLNEEVTARIDVLKARGRVVKCNTTVTNQNNEMVVEGKATVLLPS